MAELLRPNRLHGMAKEKNWVLENGHALWGDVLAEDRRRW